MDFAHENEIGLVIIASHGQSGLSGWNVSSVVQKVIMRARTSLMIVRAYQPAQTDIFGLQYHRMLVPLDNSARAECVLPLATILARIPETQILLAHVVQRPAMPRRTPPSQEDSELADRIVERNRIEAEKYLEVVRLQLPPSAVETRLLVGNQAASTLHELVDQENIDLVLLSAHGYSGEMRWPYGGLVASFVAYGSSLVDLPGRAWRADRTHPGRSCRAQLRKTLGHDRPASTGERTPDDDRYSQEEIRARAHLAAAAGEAAPGPGAARGCWPV